MQYIIAQAHDFVYAGTMMRENGSKIYVSQCVRLGRGESCLTLAREGRLTEDSTACMPLGETVMLFDATVYPVADHVETAIRSALRRFNYEFAC